MAPSFAPTLRRSSFKSPGRGRHVKLVRFVGRAMAGTRRPSINEEVLFWSFYLIASPLQERERQLYGLQREHLLPEQ